MPKDHLGKEYPSMKDMAEAYGLPSTTVTGRLGRGWSLELALTTPRGPSSRRVKYAKPVKDHLGQEFGCVRLMAEHWGITEKVYWSRKRLLHWPLEKILTEPVRDLADTANAVPVSDHLGRQFPSISAMCRHWGVALSLYRERRRRGWDIEKALTAGAQSEQVSAKPCRDHKGNEFPSEAEMCRNYGISRYAYSCRLKLGWGQERALEEPYKINARPCKDCLGNRFPSTKDMARFWALPDYALQGPRADNVKAAAASNWTGRRFGNMKIARPLDWPWFLAETGGARAVVHAKSVLDAWHNDPAFVPVDPSRRLRIIKNLSFPWFLAELDGTAIVMDYKRLIELNVSLNFGLKSK